MLHIFIRETNHNKANNDRPEWFNYERCFKSLLDSIEFKYCSLTIIFDGKPQNHYVTKYKDTAPYKYDIIEIEAGDDFKSNTKTFEYIKSLPLKQNDIIAVFENDYLYCNDWIMNVMFLYHNNTNNQIWDNTYISLFDHRDKYLFNKLSETNEWGMYKELKSQIYLGQNRYWRTIPNTCGSFIMSKEVFDKDYDIHTNGTADNTRFHELTTKRNRVVLSPMPALATHCNKYFISPLMDWRQINDKVILSSKPHIETSNIVYES